MRGRAALMPDGVMRLLGGAPSMRHGGVAETVFLLNIGDRLSLVTAMPLGDAGAKPSPLILTVRTIDQSVLASIGDRLQLANLRMIDHGADPAGDNVYAFTDGRNQPIARFAWLPQKPGAAILDFRHPLHRHCARGLCAARRPRAALHALPPRPPSPRARTGCAISRCTTRCAACRTGTSSASGWRR